jgi:probable F420-dependent oxidoreductase
MEFGIQLGNLDWQQLKEAGRAAEELGFRSVMVPDHLLHEGPERQANTDYFSYDSIVKAAVLIEATKTIEVGHLVLCNLFRHPMITAQALMSLDRLSSGRTFAGLGAGWTEREFQMSGIPFPDVGTRLRMLDEGLAVLRMLFTEDATTFDGEFYRLRDAVLHPKPIRQPHPPILLGGSGRGLLRIAAKHADIVNITAETGRPGFISLEQAAKLTDDAYRGKVRFVREEAARRGRNPRGIRISNIVFTTIITDSAAATRSACEGMAALFRVPAEAVPSVPLALIGTPDACITEVKRRTREWELGQMIFALSDQAQMRRLAEQVLPHV